MPRWEKVVLHVIVIRKQYDGSPHLKHMTYVTNAERWNNFKTLKVYICYTK